MENKDDGIKSSNSSAVTTPIATEKVMLLQSFSDFCLAHPDMRFWQALKEWADVEYIYLGSGSAGDGGHRVVDADGMAVYLRDTYHFNGRRD